MQSVENWPVPTGHCWIDANVLPHRFARQEAVAIDDALRWYLTMPPAVSVIIPAFNRLAYLRAAIESVLGQSFSDWELLIADDGSDPETQDYLRALDGRRRVRVLWLSHCGTPAVVRNAALREATGEYVAFLDSDDLWLPEKLQIQIESLRSNAAREWSYTAFILVDASGRPLTKARPAPTAGSQARLLDRLVKEEVLVVTPSVLARRELVHKVGGYNPGLPACEDFDLWVRLASRSEADFIDQPLVLVRRHGEHSFDDVTCLESLMRVMESIQRSGTAPHLRTILTRRRATIARRLARHHAASKRRIRMLAVLSSSARYSWRYADWWMGAVIAILLAFTPQRVLELLRHYRSWRGRLPERPR